MTQQEAKPPSLEDMVRSAGAGMLKHVKLGPGTIGNLTVVAAVGLASAGIAVWALSAHPFYAVLCAGGIGAFSFYFLERSFRFAERHPAEALMGGTEYYHYLRDQTAAKDKSLVLDGSPVAAGPVIEHNADV